MPAAPIAFIVPQPPRRGRPSADDREAATPTGRALHGLESAAFTISATAVSYRGLAELRVMHDAEHDAHLVAARRIVAACPTCCHTAGPRLDEAMAADEREDAAAVEGDGLVAAIHAVGRRLAGWVERVFMKLRGGR